MEYINTVYEDKVIYIENGNIKLGVNIDLGGSITFLAEIGKENMINSFDWGRQIQISFYSGPILLKGKPHTRFLQTYICSKYT